MSLTQATFSVALQVSGSPDCCDTPSAPGPRNRGQPSCAAAAGTHTAAMIAAATAVITRTMALILRHSPHRAPAGSGAPAACPRVAARESPRRNPHMPL